MTPLSWHGARVRLGQTSGSGRRGVVLGPAPLPCPKAELCLCLGWGCRYLALKGFGGASPGCRFWPLGPPPQAMPAEASPGSEAGAVAREEVRGTSR